MNFENILKGIFTSIIGAVIMGSAYYGWWTDSLTDWQSGIAGIIGFSLLWMRDQIPNYVKRFADAVIEKFKK